MGDATLKAAVVQGVDVLDPHVILFLLVSSCASSLLCPHVLPFLSCDVMVIAEASPGDRVGQGLRPLPGTFLLLICNHEIRQ
jgi:hypothetical protein